MGIDKIKSNIVAVGKKGKHDLGEANKLLVDYLQNGLNPNHGFSAYWNHDSKLVYRLNLAHVPEKVFGSKITVYTYPINFEDWGVVLKTNNVPPSFLVPEGNPKLICSLEYSLSQIKGKDLVNSVGKINGDVNAFFDLLKANGHNIVPERKLNLLWDNQYTLFIPEAFMKYIIRNETGFAVTGELNRE